MFSYVDGDSDCHADHDVVIDGWLTLEVTKPRLVHHEFGDLGMSATTAHLGTLQLELPPQWLKHFLRTRLR
jgi:hypothetical protein